MNRLRTRLLVVFLAATLIPVAITLWVTSRLIEHSLSLSPIRELDEVAQSLRVTGRALYLSACEKLEAAGAAGAVLPTVYRSSSSAPEDVRDFLASTDTERCHLSGDRLDTIQFMVRRADAAHVYSAPVPGGISMSSLSDQVTGAQSNVERARARDLRRGFLLTLGVLAATVWLISLAAMFYLARYMSRPMEQLTSGLTALADGQLHARLTPTGNDEIAKAMRAFNHTAEQLEQSRDKLIHVTRLESWQTLARKTAHEVKNSLTPIRLTMEEIVARKGERDEAFIDQAAQIVVDEVLGLERRVRAFSEFASEPPVRLAPVDINALIEERIAFLKSAHPDVLYSTKLALEPATAVVDEDLVKSMLTNLLENAAHAAGVGGKVMGRTFLSDGVVGVEVHDSGPGLTQHARNTLFEPTISFKKTGMGLGLSIAKRSAVLLGGDILLVEGELGGAAFRVLLPRAEVDAI